MFSKIRKAKGKDEEDESQNEWDPVVTEATKQQQHQQQQQQGDPEKTRGPKEASVILTGTKQVNVIVKGNKESPLAVPKVPRQEGGGKPNDLEDSRETDPLTKACNNGTDGNSDVPATVEIDLNDGEGKTEVPSTQLNWRQNLAKKLNTKSLGKKLRNPLGGAPGGGGNSLGKDNMGTPHPAPPPPPSKKSYKLPGFFDFTPTAETARLEYKFEEWNGHNLNPEYHDPPRVLTPFNHKVQSVGHKYWGEVFAAIQPVVDFAIAFFLELLAFVARVTGRLLSGTLLRLTDLLLKPLFVYTFNAILFPPFVLLANVLRAVSHSTLPLFDILERAVELVAIPLRSFRLVEIKHVHYVNNQPYNHANGSETKQPIVEDV